MHGRINGSVGGLLDYHKRLCSKNECGEMAEYMVEMTQPDIGLHPSVAGESGS